MKKYIFKSLVVLGLAGLSACNLNFEPPSDVTYGGFWEKEEAVRAGYTGIMDRFRAYGKTLQEMGELRADGWLSGKTMETPWNINLMLNQYSATQTFYTNWANFYPLIHYINDFLTNAEKASFSNVADRNNLMAQVYGLRAFVYYTLVKAYGDVIISTEPLTGDKAKDLQALRRKRSPKAEVMAFILSDIEKSLEYYAREGVAETWKAKNVYWSKAATLTLKGDALLWKGEVLKGGEADFRAAKEALSQLSSLKKLHTLVAYEQLWGQANENNTEFIFALDYAKDQAQHWYASGYSARTKDLEEKYSQEKTDQKIGGDGEDKDQFAKEKLHPMGFSGGNRYGPSDALLATLYANDKDKRQKTFALVFNSQKDEDQNLSTLRNGNNSKYLGAILRKFWGRLDKDGTRLRDENIPIYRYADALLLLAEAKNQLGEDPSTEINMIRKRAGLDEDFVSGSKIENKKAILQERFKEFVGEGKRWWDLVRAGDNLVFEYVTNIPANEAYRIYYPLSSHMIAQDPEFIKQTEGY